MVSCCFVSWCWWGGRRDFCKDLPEMKGLEVATRDYVSVSFPSLISYIVVCSDDG